MIKVNFLFFVNYFYSGFLYCKYRRLKSKYSHNKSIEFGMYSCFHIIYQVYFFIYHKE